MNIRTRQFVLISFAFVAGLALCMVMILIIAGGSWIGAAAIGGPFELIDENGRTVTDRDLRGKPFLLFFGFVRCPVVCPTTLFEMSEVLRALGDDAERTTGLMITIDPERDTPESLKGYIESFGPHMHALTGDPAKIAGVARAYRVYYKKVLLADGDYTVDHSALVYLMDKEGRFVAPFNLRRTPEAAAAELRKLL
jgi:protein SCO1/2